MVKFRVSEVNTLKIKGKPGRGEWSYYIVSSF
jgi:hypothetical protein